MYLHSTKKVSDKNYSFIGTTFKKHISSYDKLFFIKPEFDVEDDGVRSTDEKFRQYIHHEMESIINKYKLPVIRLSGTVSERTKQVLENI